MAERINAVACKAKDTGSSPVWLLSNRYSYAVEQNQRNCPKHGLTKHYEYRERTGGSRSRCAKCIKDAVYRTRAKNKQILIDEHGGKCSRCGYSKCSRALEFHHLDPKTKEHGLSYLIAIRSLAKARVEAEKCVLVCSNCHAEIESGMV